MSILCEFISNGRSSWHHVDDELPAIWRLRRELNFDRFICEPLRRRDLIADVDTYHREVYVSELGRTEVRYVDERDVHAAALEAERDDFTRDGFVRQVLGEFVPRDRESPMLASPSVGEVFARDRGCTCLMCDRYIVDDDAPRESIRFSGLLDGNFIESSPDTWT